MQQTCCPGARESKFLLAALVIDVKEGKLINSYPVEVAVSNGQNARFTVAGGVGYVPVTFTGLSRYDGYKLYELRNGKKQEVNQSVGGNAFWQTDYDIVGRTWSITYNVKMGSVKSPLEQIEFVFTGS